MKRFEQRFKFSKDGNEDLVLSPMGSKEWEIAYRGIKVGSFEFKRKKLKEGMDFTLPDGSHLLLKLAKRGAIWFWEPFVNGMLAYNIILSQHRYIWISWIIAPILISVMIIVENFDVPGADEVLLPWIFAIIAVGWIEAFLVTICWKPIAWIFAVECLVGLVLTWGIWLDHEYGLPPIMETVGVIVFRDFFVNAKFIWRTLEQMKAYRESKAG